MNENVKVIKSDDSILFRRKFRFNCFPGNWGGGNQFVKNASYSLRPKELWVSFFDVVLPDGTPPARDYVNYLLREGATDSIDIKLYSGTGDEIGSIKFEQCRLVRHHYELDMDSSAHASHDLRFEYEHADTSNM